MGPAGHGPAGGRPGAGGRDPTPSGACIDSPPAKTASGGEDVGIDGGKRVRGRKRHIVTDTPGLLPAVAVTAANLGDGETASRVLGKLRSAELPRLAVVWADGTYRNHNRDAGPADQDRLRVEVTREPEGEKGFRPLEKRWGVEQAFGCLVRSRRMTRDDERRTATSAAMVPVACVHRMARRATPPRGRRTFRYKRKTATAI